MNPPEPYFARRERESRLAMRAAADCTARAAHAGLAEAYQILALATQEN